MKLMLISRLILSIKTEEDFFLFRNNTALTFFFISFVPVSLSISQVVQWFELIPPNQTPKKIQSALVQLPPWGRNTAFPALTLLMRILTWTNVLAISLSVRFTHLRDRLLFICFIYFFLLIAPDPQLHVDQESTSQIPVTISDETLERVVDEMERRFKIEKTKILVCGYFGF